MCSFIGETGSELPAGASGGIYPQVKPDLVAGCHISAGGGGNKSDPGGTALPHVIKHTLDDKVTLAAAESDTGTGISEIYVNGRSSAENLPGQKNLVVKKVTARDQRELYISLTAHGQ